MAVNVGQRNVNDTSWCANAAKGNSYKLIQRMTKFYNNLWEEKDNAD